MKMKKHMLLGLCAALFGAGLGVSNAQVLDLRCQSCQTHFQACISQCDYIPENSDCYRGCFVQRRACVATFCAN
jgi:hypothetical protein